MYIENTTYENILGKRQFKRSENPHFLGFSHPTIFLAGVTWAEPLASPPYGEYGTNSWLLFALPGVGVLVLACRVLAW